MNSHFGTWSPNGLLNLQKAIIEVKINWIKEFLVLLKRSWNVDVEMGLHDPFGQLKHKLWHKKGSGVKLPI